MAYQVKPDATDRLNQSQADIKNNFQDIQTAFALNHIDFNNGTESGKHKFLQLPVQTSAPTTSMTEMALYTKDVSGTPQMFIKRNTGSGDEIDITSLNNSGAQFSTTLPSGLILKAGSGSTTNGVGSISFAPAFPTAVISIQITPRSVGGLPEPITSGVSGLSVSGASLFVANSTNGTVTGITRTFYWTAIGY